MATETEDGPQQKTVYLHDPASHVGAALAKQFPASTYALLEPQKETAGVVEKIIQADYVIFDMRADWELPKNALQELEKAQLPEGRTKLVILISTVMTWAATPQEQEEQDLPLAEEDFRKRKPHANYRKHLFLEKYALKLNRPGLTVFVVAAGLVYGGGEDVLHFLFKAAWLGQPPELPCIGKAGDALGTNIIPAIHVQDLCSVVMALVKRPLAEDRYVLAVDLGNHTLRDMVQAISTTVGTGKVKALAPEEALATYGLSQRDFDLLQVHMRMESVVLKDMGVPWVCENGFVEGAAQAAKEYREARGLTPVRIAVLGPPAAGKTALGEAIAARYTIHRVHAKDVVERALEADKDKELAERRDAVTGRLNDEDLAAAFAGRLNGWQCQNQGYVLDGFPKTNAQLRLLFGGRAADAAEGAQDDEPARAAAPPPEHVFVLEAEDSALRGRVMATRDGDEERFERRLKEYRANCTPDSGPAASLESIGVLPIPLDAALPLDTLLQLVAREVGAPHRYGPTPEEVEEQRRTAERASREAAKREEEGRAAREAAEREKRAAAAAAWDARLTELRTHERELLQARSQPFRQYLMDAVMPTLTRALVELAEARPQDPVDYLAQYLLRAALQQS